MKTFEEKNIIGSKVTLCNKKQLLSFIGNSIKTHQKNTVLSGNIHSFNLAHKHKWLRDYINSADIVRLDGAGLRVAAFILGRKTPPRMTWSDFIWDLSDYCLLNNYSLFFLGNAEGIAREAAKKIQTTREGLQIKGTINGYFDKTIGSEENESVIKRINSAKPDILIVGFGMPLQEKWLQENRSRIDVPVVMTGGAIFEWVIGKQKRGSEILLRSGFEWLTRLIADPKRLWRRYLIGNPVFLFRVLLQRIGLHNG